MNLTTTTRIILNTNRTSTNTSRKKRKLIIEEKNQKVSHLRGDKGKSAAVIMLIVISYCSDIVIYVTNPFCDPGAQ